MNWNLETFFDAEFDGNEYAEFKNSKSGWSREKYAARLDRLASVVKTIDADVLVMEELEKEGQLFDITNRLSATFDSSKIYRYGYFTAGEGGSIGCGVLSRIPIAEVLVHSLDIQNGVKQPSMRPIIQLSFDAPSESGKRLVLFVNHWKSKSGGAEESDVWRDYQEKQLSRLIEKEIERGNAVLACGDFNRSIEEFCYKCNEECNIVLKGGARVYSPWFDENENLSEVGSYWYNDSWEYIDNFFSSNLELTDFTVHNSGDWADEKGHPKRYKIYTGQGYSDHLPISCKVFF